MLGLTKSNSVDKPQAANPKSRVFLYVSAFCALLLLLYFANRNRWPFCVYKVAISPAGDQIFVFHNTNFFLPALIPSKGQVSLCDLQNQQVLWTSTIQRRFVARLMFSPEGTPAVLHESGYYSMFDKNGHATESRLTISGRMSDAIIVDNEVFAINVRGEWCHGDLSDTFEPRSLFDSEWVTSSIAPDGEFITVVDLSSAQHLHIQQIKKQQTQMIEFKDDIDSICALNNQQILVATGTGSCFLVTLSDNQAEPVVKHLISSTEIRSTGTHRRFSIDSTNDGSLFVLYTAYQKPLMNIIEKKEDGYKLTTVIGSQQLSRNDHSLISQVVCSETKDFFVWVSRFNKMGIVKKINGVWIIENSF